jgi:hypothetical protein
MFAGQDLYKDDVENNKTRDIYNFTENSLNSSKIITQNYLPTDIEDNHNIFRFKKVFNNLIFFMGDSTSELAKWSIEYGYSHPEQDLPFFLDIFIKFMIITLIIACIPLIVPLLALIYLLFKGFYLLLKFGWDKTYGKKRKG